MAVTVKRLLERYLGRSDSFTLLDSSETHKNISTEPVLGVYKNRPPLEHEIISFTDSGMHIKSDFLPYSEIQQIVSPKSKEHWTRYQGIEFRLKTIERSYSVFVSGTSYVSNAQREPDSSLFFSLLKNLCSSQPITFDFYE